MALDKTNEDNQENPSQPEDKNDEGDKKDENGGDDDVNQDDDEKKKDTNPNDFVIREGFPALRLPGGKKGPWIDGDEPLPRHLFWASAGAALELDSNHFETLISDCEEVFSARAMDNPNQAYSAGVTYFVPCQMKPRCALEALALAIFQKHTEDILEDGVMVPEQSGAEWWTLVLDDDKTEEKKVHSVKEGEKDEKDGTADNNNNDDDEEDDDEVGLHFDADYGLEDQAPNLLLHPRIATVTYLSDYGAPTVVLNKRSHRPDQNMKDALGGDIAKGWLSHPIVGKHVAFDGRLLHGAPATFFPPKECSSVAKRQSGNDNEATDLDEPPAKRAKQENSKGKRRITFLVNIWINHCPLDAEPIDDELCDLLKTPFKKDENSNTCENGNGSKSVFTWVQERIDLSKPPTCEKVLISAASSDEEPAGSEEFVLCSHHVTAMYNATMADLHDSVKKGDLVELNFKKGTLSLEIGDKVESSDDEESEDGSL